MLQIVMQLHIDLILTIVLLIGCYNHKPIYKTVVTQSERYYDALSKIRSSEDVQSEASCASSGVHKA